MAAAGGIYIAIRGDYSQFDADMNRVRQTAKSYADGIAADLNNAVNPSQLTRGLSRITEALAQAKRSLETQAPRVQWLDAIAKEANVSKKQLESLSNQWLQTQRTMTQDRAFAQLQQMTGTSTAQLAQLRRELGNVSGALKAAMSGMNIRTQSAIVEDMRNVVASYREVRNNATATASDVKWVGDTMRESHKQLSAEARGMKAPNLKPFHSTLQTLTQNA